MARNGIILLLVGIVAIFMCSGSHADVPQMINYQGKLTTPAGAPVNDTLPMVFTIYADTGGTTPLWTETQPAVIVEKGVFNVLLGSVDSIPYSVFDGSIRYLGVKVGDDPEITPRKPMVSVAYAYKSFEADTADFSRAGAGGGTDNDWVFPTLAGGTNPRPYLYTYGAWGIARKGNTLYGTNDSTHVNLGVACTTGTSGQNYKYCTVGGGLMNTASGSSATVGGGDHNTASLDFATVGGGYSNTAINYYTTVGGGQFDTASGEWATVGGGWDNTASGERATVGGGFENTASGYSATVGGGDYNTASGYEATVGGGYWNHASNANATVGGGRENTASGDYATVAGGYGNTASLDYATVGGGWDNTASGKQATVGGGFTNTVSGYYATLGGGLQNTVAGFWATVGGGAYNSDSGNYSVIPGGYRDTLTDAAQMSMVFGAEVYVNNSYRVVFFEGTNSGRLGINRDDHDGGISYPIHVGTNTGNGNGAYLTTGGVWTNGSSRTFKENFQALNRQKLLEKISSLPVEAWNFKNSEERHIGPMAEDFVSAFDVGTVGEDGTRDDKYLSTEDVAGVALAGVKELIKQNQELKQTIEELSQKIAKLEKGR